MTVKELIEKLQQCPAELPVRYHYYNENGSGSCCPVNFVSVDVNIDTAYGDAEVFLSTGGGIKTI